jgi:hypothetical protein
MGIESEVHSSKGSASVRVLTSPEELAEALARAEDYERRISQLVASRAERHQAALARAPGTPNAGVSTTTSN